MSDPAMPIDVDLLANRLGVDSVHDVTVREVDYAIPAMTTGGRWWVEGIATTGTTTTPFTVFLKLVQTVRRSPVMAYIPPALHDQTEATLPWRVEPDVYGSSLASALPAGTRMPGLLGIDRPDADSALLWLEAVDVDTTPWTSDTWTFAARTLGRLAGSPAAREVADAVGHPVGPGQARAYWEGRLTHQFGQAYRGDDLWRHPVLAAHVDDACRDRLLSLLDAVPALIDEIEGLPLLTGHGDASPNNLLRTVDGLAIIDWGFFGRLRLGFDLGQLVMSEVDEGLVPASVLPDRQATCLGAYRDGLADVGVDVSPATLARAHHVQLAISHGVASIPLERLGDDPARLAPLVVERLAALDHVLTPLRL